MSIKRIQHFIIISLLTLSLIIPCSALIQETEKKTIEQPITSWLMLGPFPSPLPAFHGDMKKDFTVEDLLRFEELDTSRLKPKSDNSVKWHDGTLARWESVQGGEKGISIARNPAIPSTAYLGVYIDTSRWTKARLTVTSPQLFLIYFDREIVARAGSAKSEKGNISNEGKKTSTDLVLETGKHLLLVKTLFDPQSSSDWTLKATLSYDEKFDQPFPSLTLSADQKMTIKHLLDSPQVTAVSISPDGALAALSKSQSLPPSDDSESWVEIYQIAEGRLLQTYRGGLSISAVNWAPDGKKFSYTSHGKQGGTIWIVDLESGTSTAILKNIKDLGSHVWSPDGKFIIWACPKVT
jgi:hypothetical protein